MKKLALLLFISFLFVGCATTRTPVPTNSGSVSISDPIFIDEFPQPKLISVNFTNTSNYEDIDLTNYIVTRLRADGFNVVAKKDANIFVEGNINYIDKKVFGGSDTYARPRVRGSVGFGFGSGHRGHHYSHFGFGLGFPIFAPSYYDDVYYTEYAYIGQVSLLVRIKDTKESHTTNLNYKSVANPGAFERVSESFKHKIYQQIKQILSR